MQRKAECRGSPLSCLDQFIFCTAVCGNAGFCKEQAKEHTMYVTARATPARRGIAIMQSKKRFFGKKLGKTPVWFDSDRSFLLYFLDCLRFAPARRKRRPIIGSIFCVCILRENCFDTLQKIDVQNTFCRHFLLYTFRSIKPPALPVSTEKSSEIVCKSSPLLLHYVQTCQSNLM